MSENVQINLNVTDNGTTAKANAEAAKLRGNLEGAQRAASNTRAFAASAAARPASSALGQASEDSNIARGVEGVTGAASRDFAAQAQGLGGLVHVYATFAANLFAVTAAFSALSKAADVTNMVKGLDQLGAASGQALGSMAKHLTTLTDGALSLKDAMTATAQATSGGLSVDQLNRLTIVAKNASQALGRDMPDAMSRLTRGIVKIEPELLDELGIMAKVIPSQQAYALQLGKSVAALTDFEKRQAFANAVITEGENKFGSIQIDANPYSKLLASMTNLAIAGAELANKILGPVVKILAESPTALTTVMAGIAGLLVSKAIPALGQWREELVKSADEAVLNAKRINDSFLDFKVKEFLGPSTALAAEATKYKESAAEIITTNKLFSESSKIFYTAMSTDSEFTKSNLLSVQASIGKTNTAIDLYSKKRAELKGVRGEGEARAELDADIESLYQKKAYLTEVEDLITKSISKNIAAKEAGDLAQYNIDKKYSALALENWVREQQAKKAASRAASLIALSNVGADTQVMGLTSALEKLYATTSNDKNLSKFAAGITNIKGTTIALSASVMSLASAISNVFMVVGIAVTIFELFDKINSGNAKQVAELSNSLDILNTATTGLSNTTELMNSRSKKDGESITSTHARAVALQELADAAKNTAKVLLSTDAAATEWDRFWDYIKSSVGKDIRSQTTKSLSNSIEEAMKDATSGPAKDKARTALQNLLNIKDLNTKSIEEALNILDKGGFKDKYKAATEVLSEFAHETSNSSSALDSFKESMKDTDKQLQTLMNSYIPSDNASKFAMAQIQKSFALGKALQDPIEGLKALVEIVTKTENLKLFPPESIVVLQGMSKEIISLNDDFRILNTRIRESKEKIAALEKTMNPTDKEIIASGPIDKLIRLYDTYKASKELPDEKNNLAKLENIEQEKRARAIEIANITAEIADKSYKAGADVLAKSLTQASEQAGITFSKAISSIMKGTGSAKLDADIARQEVSMQEKMLQSDAELIRSQKELTLTIEQGNLLNKLASEKTTEEEKKTIATSLATNSRSLDFVRAKHSNGTLTDLNNEPDPKVRQELLNYATAMLGIDQKRIGLAGQYNVIAINERIAGIRSTISEEQKGLSERSKDISLEQESNNNILASVGIYSEELQNRKEALSIQLETLKVLEMQFKIAGLRKEQEAITNSSASKDVKSAMNKTYNDAISHANIDLANEEQALAQKTFKIKYDNQVLLYNEQVRLGSQVLKADKASVDLKMDSISIETNKLDTINSIYTINQELYNDQKAQLELSKVKMQLDIDLAQIEFDKKAALGKLALDNIAAEEAAWQEFERNQDSVLLASNMAAIGRARALRQAQIEQDSNIGISAATSKAGVSSAAIENTKLLNEETRKTNELLATQASLIESLTTVFGDFGTSIGNVVKGFINMTTAQEKLNNGYKNQVEDTNKNDKLNAIEKETELTKLKDEYTKKSTKNELDGIIAIVGGVKGLFKEKSTAYKILDGIEKASAAARMVFAAQDLYTRYMTMVAIAEETALEESAAATSMALNIEEGMVEGGTIPIKMASGAATMFGQSGWAAFAGVAAMVALIASLSGGSSGAAVSIPKEATAEYQQKNQGTGTVLGDSTAHSDSIATGIKILSEHSFEMLDYTQRMLTALKSMDKGITNLADSLAKIGGITGIGGLSAFGTVEKHSVDPGFFNTHTSDTSITDAGIIIQGTVDALIALTGTIKQYEVVVETWSDSGFFGLGADSGTNISTNLKDLKSSTAIKDIGLIFSGMKDSIREGMKLLSFSPTEVADILNSVGKIDFVGDELKASLKGLSGEDIKNALNGVFSAAFDKMADFAVPWAKNFQKVGEGVGETLVRLASDARTLNMSLETAGMGMDSFNTQFSNFNDKSDRTIFADPVKVAQRKAAQNAVDAAEAHLAELKNKSPVLELFTDKSSITGLAESIPALNEITAAEKTLTEANQALAIASIGASDSIMTYNEALVKAQQYLLNGAGGAGAFNSKMQFFTENFLTDSQRLTPVTLRVRQAFADMTPKSSEIGSIAGLGAQLKSMNMQVPTTRTEFAELMATLSDPGNKLGITTEAGADLYNTLLTLAPAFAAVMSAMEGIASTVADIASRGEEMKRSFTLDTLDTEGKYAYLKREDTTTRATMLAKNDKGEYVQTFAQSAISANKLLDTINEAWGLMDETQKNANLSAYTQKVDEVMTFMKARGIAEMAGMSPDGINTVEAINKSADLIATAIGKLDPNYNKTKDTTLATATKNITQDNIDTIISQTFAAFSSMKLSDTASYTDPLSIVADKLPEVSKIEASAAISSVDSIATAMGTSISESISSAIATNPQISAILANPTDAGVTAAGMTTAQLPTAMSGVLDSLNASSSATITSIDKMVSMFSGLETTLANAPGSPEVEAFKQDLENNKQALIDQKNSIEAQQAAATAAVAELAAGTGSLSSVAGALQGLISSLAAVAKEPANVNVSVKVSAPVGSEVGSSVT